MHKLYPYQNKSEWTEGVVDVYSDRSLTLGGALEEKTQYSNENTSTLGGVGESLMALCTLGRKYFELIFKFLYSHLAARILRNKSMMNWRGAVLVDAEFLNESWFFAWVAKVITADCSTLDSIVNYSRINDFERMNEANRVSLLLWAKVDWKLTITHPCVSRDLEINKGPRQCECR